MTSKRQSMMSNASMLALFAFACTLLVVIVNFFTEDKIAEQIQRQLVKSTNEVLNPELAASSYQQQCFIAHSEPLLGNAKQQTVRVISQNQQTQALVYQTTAPDGYSGAIQLLVGVNSDGSVSGVRVVQHNETPGLGDKIETRKSDWIYQFNQQRLVADDDSRWAVKKDGGQFDAFTGATITPRAVIKAVKNVLIYHKANQQQIIQSASDC
ncbi:electron transport complex subunit RsxG [Agarivorans sp.]|uniref:electron transport complex subunit RsxG n=1 Tax=Agarivorans sp. TaxID=1872412 RepID=UPI003D068824